MANMPITFNECFALTDTEAISLAFRKIEPVKQTCGLDAGKVFFTIAALRQGIKALLQADGNGAMAELGHDCRIHICVEKGFDGNGSA